MQVVNIATKPRSYKAVISNGLLAQTGEQLRRVAGERRTVFVVTVPVVWKKWGRLLAKSLTDARFRVQVLEIPEGERHKRLATVEKLSEQLVKLKADRDAILIAFGGGVVGDVTGLLASLYMRGVDFVQIPTTVLAQVDASIGGKTGVNLQVGKNLVGTFHQPLMVLIDPAVLSTLSDREFRAGLYESLKCGVIGNVELFAALESGFDALRHDEAMLEWIIVESVKLKAQVVSADELESGLRRVLNFGHTIGHALEADSGYKRFLHGEAVAWGMMAAVRIAELVGICDTETAQRICEAVRASGSLPAIQSKPSNLVRLSQSDKKTRDGVVHFVLPREIGKVEIVNDVPGSTVVEAVRWVAKSKIPPPRTLRSTKV